MNRNGLHIMLAPVLALTICTTCVTAPAMAGDADHEITDDHEDGTSFFGEAKDIAGMKPIGAVRVRTQIKGTMRFLTGQTDDEGRFKIRGLGPDIDADTVDVLCEKTGYRVIDTIRRAYETVRLMNTTVQNGTQNVGGVPTNGNNMAGQQTNYGRAFEPFFTPATAQYDSVLARHLEVLQQALSAAGLEGSFTAFALMRSPDDIGNLRTPARRRMPAMMRGSDGLELALTWRQLAKLRLAGAATPAGPSPLAMTLGGPTATTADATQSPTTEMRRLTVPPPVATKAVSIEEQERRIP